MRSDKPLTEAGMGRIQIREPMSLRLILDRSIADLVYCSLGL